VQSVSRVVYDSGCYDRHNSLWWDSVIGSVTQQLDLLPLGHNVIIFLTSNLADRHSLC